MRAQNGVPSPPYPLKKNVEGWELPGVRQCWALICRSGMFPIFRLTTRTPIVAGDWPTVPIEYTWSTRIFQISWATL